jgi:hypothetical protein
MALLFFWRGENYPNDMVKYGKSYGLNQNNELMNKVKKGEHIWAFTRRDDKTYVLALDLCILSKQVNTPQDPGYEYGIYNVEGDPIKSRYFNIKKRVNIEPLIRSLSITANAKILGHSFRGKNGVKFLNSIDEQVLIKFASNLPTI